MPKMRLLVSVMGNRGVHGDPGDVVEVDRKTAHAWCDGVRAERVVDREPAVERAVVSLTRKS